MKEIQLTQGKVALVDDEDFHYLNQWNWAASKGKNYVWYAARKEGRQRINMHRQITNFPKNQIIDHRDRNGLNNQKSNLRICTIQQNNCNRRSAKNSTSKYLGVCTLTHRGTFYYQAGITYNKKKKLLYRGKSELKAAWLYDEAAIKLHGEFANLNFK